MVLHNSKKHEQSDWAEAQDVYKEMIRDKLVSDRGTGQ